MTFLEFLLAVSFIVIIILQCVILLELHNYRVTLLLRASRRRQWMREEHADD